MHRNCEQCRSEFWAKMPWARFCSTNCRVLSAYHKKRHQALHSANEARGRNMSGIRAGTGLPEHVKRQAAPDMLRGTQRQFYGPSEPAHVFFRRSPESTRAKIHRSTHLAWSDSRLSTGLVIAGTGVAWDTAAKPHPKTASESRLQAQ